MQKISPIKQRILYFIDHLNITKRDFYRKTNISRGTIESSSGITEDIVAKFIATFPDVNIVWLITGDGPMLEGSKNISHIAGPHAIYEKRTSADSFESQIKILEIENEALKKEIQLKDKIIKLLEQQK